MPYILAALWGGLQYAAGSIIVQALIGLGIAVATYSGTDIAMEWAKTQAVANLAALPPDLLAMLAFMKVGKAINIVFSAMTMRFAMDATRDASGNLSVKKFFKK